MATSGGGTLYPPNILHIDDIKETDILEYKNTDDLFLKKIEIDLNVPLVWVKNDFLTDMHCLYFDGLFVENKNGGNDDALNRLQIKLPKKDLTKDKNDEVVAKPKKAIAYSMYPIF